MEVELDLWSSRSSDPVDSILSDVDCLGDVPDVDVDEFIMAACSSSEATGGSLQDAELDHHHHEHEHEHEHEQHDLNHISHMNHHNHHHHLSSHHHHLSTHHHHHHHLGHHLDHQLGGPLSHLGQMNHLGQHQHHLGQHEPHMSPYHKQHQQHQDPTLHHHQHLHTIFDETNTQQHPQSSSSPSTMSFQQQQLTQTQQSQQQSQSNQLQQQHQSTSSNPRETNTNNSHQSPRPLSQQQPQHTNDCCNDLTSHNLNSLAVDHQNPTAPNGYEPRQQQQQQRQTHHHYQSSATSYSDYLIGNQYQASQANRQPDHQNSNLVTTTSNEAQKQQQQSLGLQASSESNNNSSNTSNGSSNSSLVASRVDHCYILNDLIGGGEGGRGATGDSPTLEVDANGTGPNLSSQLGQLRQVVPANANATTATTGGKTTTTTTSTVGSSTTRQLLDREQLQLLLESRPQPISCSLDDSPLIAAIQAGQQTQTTQATGAKRRQASSSSGKTAAPRKRAKQQPAASGQDSVDGVEMGAKHQQATNCNSNNNNDSSKRTITSTTTKTPRTKTNNSSNNADSLSQPALDQSGGNSKSLTRRANRTAAPSKRSKSNGQKAPESTGQVSPTLSSGSSSGVSSLAFSLADDSDERPFSEQHESQSSVETQQRQSQQQQQSQPQPLQNQRSRKPAGRPSSQSSKCSVSQSNGPSELVASSSDSGSKAACTNESVAAQSAKQRRQATTKSSSKSLTTTPATGNTDNKVCHLSVASSSSNSAQNVPGNSTSATTTAASQRAVQKPAIERNPDETHALASPSTATTTPTTTSQTAAKSAAAPKSSLTKLEMGVCADQPIFSLSDILHSQAAAAAASGITSSTGSSLAASLITTIGSHAQKGKQQQQQKVHNAKSAANNTSQLSFEANLSPSSRQKLSNLSSCLIINQLPASVKTSESGGAQKVASKVKSEKHEMAGSSSATITATKTTTAPGSGSSSSSCNSPASSSSSLSLSGPCHESSGASSLPSGGRSSVSSSSAGSSASSTSLARCSLSSSSSAPASITSPSSIRRTSTAMSSPVSSVSSSPTMQLGSAGAQCSHASSPTSSMSSSSSSSSSMSSSSSSSLLFSSSSSPSMSMISSQDWKSAQTGQTVMLTEEERRTLIAEGYPIPQKFPLTKSEERSLKKIRRKIKNKISAQESRRKKKEYMEELEKRVHIMEMRIAELERENERLSRLSTASSSSLPFSGSCSDDGNNQIDKLIGKQHQMQPQQEQQQQPSRQGETTQEQELTAIGGSGQTTESGIKLEPVELASTHNEHDNNNNARDSCTGLVGQSRSQEPSCEHDIDGGRLVTAPVCQAEQDERANGQTTTATNTPTTDVDNSLDQVLGLADVEGVGRDQTIEADNEPQQQQFDGVAQRKNSVQSNFSTNINDDELIDDILMSQEHQDVSGADAEVGQLTGESQTDADNEDDDDLVGNLVAGNVCNVGLERMIDTKCSSLAKESNGNDLLAGVPEQRDMMAN